MKAFPITPRNGEPSAPRAGVLLVEDHPVVRDALAQLIDAEPDLEVCATCVSVAQAWEALEKHRPLLVIVDLILPDGHGLELIREIRARHPSAQVLVFSMHDELAYGERALLAGAAGYVTKDAPPHRLIEAMRAVLTGKVAVGAGLSERMVRRALGTRLPEAPLELLSNRELEVFELIGRGFSTKEIADQLKRSVKTIETHRQRLKTKLDIRSHDELIAQAARWGAVKEGS